MLWPTNQVLKFTGFSFGVTKDSMLLLSISISVLSSPIVLADTIYFIM